MLLVPCALAGDDGAHVHLGTGGRQGQHAAQRNGGGHLAPDGLEDVPGIPGRIVVSGRGDELGAVQHGAAAHCQQEVDLLGAGQFDGAHQGFIGGVGLDAAKFKQGQAGQLAADLVQQAAAHHAATAVGDEDAGVAGDLAAQLGHLALAEQHLGGVCRMKLFMGSPGVVVVGKVWVAFFSYNLLPSRELSADFLPISTEPG